MLKKILTILFVMVLFTGCGKQNSKTSIKFASWGSQSEISILKPILNDFERQNPDLRIEFIHIPQNYFQKLHLLFASNLEPDVIFINNLYLPIYSNHLEDLSNKVQKNIFFDKSIEAMSVNSKIFAIPRDMSNLVIYYNKDLFDKNKIPYPSNDWTFNDFLNIAKKLTHDGIWGISFEKAPLFYLPYLMSEGGGILSDDLSKVIIDEPQSQKGLNFYADLRKKYNVAPKQYESASRTMAQMFIQGKLGMQLSGRWLVPKYREVLTFNWDIINFPNGSNGSIVPMDASGWAISKNSKNKENAYKLIEFLSSKENIEKFTQSGLITPARVDVANSDIFLNGEPNSAHVFLDVIKTSKKTPVSKDYQEITDRLAKKLDYKF